jgi:hypothetical protein
MDRTKEFSEVLSFLGAAQRARMALPNKQSNETPKKETISLVDFHQAASSMSQEIHTTTQKVCVSLFFFLFFFQKLQNYSLFPLHIVQKWV